MTISTEKLALLLQLASPALPVGAYSYSGGLEAAIEAGVVTNAASAQRWIGDVLEHSIARMEAPLFLRLCSQDADIERWNELFLASRETAELRAETVQMGYSLNLLLPELGVENVALEEPAFPTVFARAAITWGIEPREALLAYLWAWLENQVMAALKAVPLGQTEGQKMLLALGEKLLGIVEEAARMDDEELGNLAPGLALASARHETQYSRLFRS
ncbi:MAG: urease accessory protein UreF [Betaproteobacteria bacterium RIFCSPLOWO2_12_FULL_68_20]|nr:MAG: urease accessory protein UreF [Betaproteobacteria bacterium RIFCSPLOWO2_12_FULL_68_20]